MLNGTDKNESDLPKTVTALLFKDGRVLSVSRKDDSTALGLPGGKVDPGESLEEALVRELFEETGVRASSYKQVFEAVSSSGTFYGYTFWVEEWEGKPYSVEAGVVSWVDPERLVAPSQPFRIYNWALFHEIGLLTAPVV